jgi:Amt family ammonium transporter
MLKHKLGYDDSLDAFGVHGVGGAFGAVATGVFATVGATGLIAGNAHQLLVQLIGVVAAGAYAVAVTAILLVVLRATMGLRVTDEEERMGLDQTAHSESGYNI